MEFMKNIIKKIKNKLYCDKGNHNWTYCIAGNRVVEIDGEFSFADIPMRHCKDCNYSEEKWFDNKWREYKRIRNNSEKGNE